MEDKDKRAYNIGRTERVGLRITQADKDTLEEIKRQTGKSAADVMAEIVAIYRTAHNIP